MTWIGRLSKTVLLALLIPLFVTVVGGLMVEYLKPAEKAYTPVYAHDAEGPKPQAQDVSMAAKIQQLLVRKWSVSDKPIVYGDLDVEFTDQGQMVRTYYRSFPIPNDITSHPYEVLEGGHLKSDVDLKLVKITNDDLILSWNGTIAHYKRGMYWWEVALIVLGVVLGLMILGVAGSR